MQEFHVRKNGFDEIKKKLIVLVVAMMVVIFAVVVLLAMWLSDEGGQWDTSLYLIILLSAVGTITIIKSLKRQRQLFGSFVVKIDNEKIVRERMDTPTMVMHAAEITRITKNANGSFTVQGKSRFNVIGIPAQMDDYESLEQALNQLKEVIVRRSKTLVEKMAIFLTMIPLVLMVVTTTSENDGVAALASVLLVLVLCASLVLTVSNDNFDHRTKKYAWVVLIPILVFSAIAFVKIKTLLGY